MEEEMEVGLKEVESIALAERTSSELQSNQHRPLANVIVHTISPWCLFF